MASSTINQLSTLVAGLHRERDTHVAAIADIDDVFARLGLSAGQSVRRGARPGRPKSAAGGVGRPFKKRRRRGTFSTTANELMLTTIRRAGPKGATGAQLSKVWKSAGRPGDAYNTLTTLSKAKAIRRQKIDGERGSRYTVR